MQPSDADGGGMNIDDPSSEDGASNNLSGAVPKGRIEWRVIDEDGNDITDQYSQAVHADGFAALAGIQAINDRLQELHLSDSFACWQKIRKAMSEVTDKLPGYSNIFQNVYPEMRSAIDACARVISSVNYEGIEQAARKFAELASRLSYINVLERTEWPLYLVSDERMAKNISGLNASLDAETLRSQVCEIALESLGSEWIDEVHTRWMGHGELSDGERALLTLALDYHGRGEYEACVSILMCLIEGFLKKYCERPNALTEQQKDDFDLQAKQHGLDTIVSPKGKRRNLQNSKDLVLVLLVRTENGYYFWNAATSYVVDVVLTNVKDFEGKAAHNPLRNKICHGQQTNYGTKEHSLKAILAMDLVMRLGCAARLALDSESDNG